MMSIENAVRAWADGIYPMEAGAELLIRHGKAIHERAPWLIELRRGDGERMVSIDTERLSAEIGVWSSGEQRVARIALSLLDQSMPVDLNASLPVLDRASMRLVLAAVAHAGGSHEHSYDSTELPPLVPWPRPPGATQAHNLDEGSASPNRML